MEKKKEKNLFLPKIGEWWDSLCLKGNPSSMRLQDFLEFESHKENLTVYGYIQKHGIERETIRVDAINFFCIGMGIAYRNFSKLAKNYDQIVEFKEYFGERALFGLLREYIITAEGLKYTNKPKL